jgi:hypothetical protein
MRSFLGDSKFAGPADEDVIARREIRSATLTLIPSCVRSRTHSGTKLQRSEVTSPISSEGCAGGYSGIVRTTLVVGRASAVWPARAFAMAASYWGSVVTRSFAFKCTILKPLALSCSSNAGSATAVDC